MGGKDGELLIGMVAVVVVGVEVAEVHHVMVCHTHLHAFRRIRVTTKHIQHMLHTHHSRGIASINTTSQCGTFRNIHHSTAVGLMGNPNGTSLSITGGLPRYPATPFPASRDQLSSQPPCDWGGPSHRGHGGGNVLGFFLEVQAAPYDNGRQRSFLAGKNNGGLLHVDLGRGALLPLVVLGTIVPVSYAQAQRHRPVLQVGQRRTSPTPASPPSKDDSFDPHVSVIHAHASSNEQASLIPDSAPPRLLDERSNSFIYLPLDNPVGRSLQGPLTRRNHPPTRDSPR